MVLLDLDERRALAERAPGGTPTTTSTALSRNGIRQPQLSRRPRAARHREEGGVGHDVADRDAARC